MAGIPPSTRFPSQQLPSPVNRDVRGQFLLPDLQRASLLVDDGYTAQVAMTLLLTATPPPPRCFCDHNAGTSYRGPDGRRWELTAASWFDRRRGRLGRKVGAIYRRTKLGAKGSHATLGDVYDSKDENFPIRGDIHLVLGKH